MSAERELAMRALAEKAERMLAEAVDALEPFADASARIDAQYEDETGWQGPMRDDETATIMPLGDHWDVVNLGQLRRARDVVRKVKP